MSINVIWDTIRSLAQALQVATVFPAALLVLFNVYILVPNVGNQDNALSSPLVIGTIALTLMLSYTLYAFNYPLIRLLEGYVTPPLMGHIIRLLSTEKTCQHQWIHQRIDVLKKEARDIEGEAFDFQAGEPKELPLEYYKKHQEMAFLQQTLDTDYPSKLPLPTELGNIIAAFEEYPQTRYGIAAVAVWPRLIPILKEENYLDFVVQEKMIFDFLLNTGLAVIALGFEIVALNFFWNNVLSAFLVTVLTSLIGYGFYRGLIIAARSWGLTVRVAFDLYRHHLYERLHLKPASTPEDEQQNWEAYSHFVLYTRTYAEPFKGFVPQNQFMPSAKMEPTPSSE